MELRRYIGHLLCFFVLMSCACAAGSEKEREPGVAGQFYPADAKQLSNFIDGTISNLPKQAGGGRVLGLIAPHAGYVYSGAIAATSYAAIKGQEYRRVIVIGPSHFEAFGYTSVYNGDAYITPLGRLPVDKSFAAALAKQDPSIRLSGAGHVPTKQGTEHSVEVQLPFLQRSLNGFTIVPIVMGDPSYAKARSLGLALAKLLRGDQSTLIVASSDLSHYHDYGSASRMDRGFLDAAAAGDFLSIWINDNTRRWEACGVGPVMAMMMAAERLGASEGTLLKYANSGDTSGDKSRVVGYGAVVFRERSTKNVSEASYSLVQTEKDQLLSIARRAVESAVRDGRPYEPVTPSSTSLISERGAFVTITKKGELRGCIGYVTASDALYLTVRNAAVAAALEDPRFPPVRPEELKDLGYEVSVISPFHLVLNASDVHVGEDGLYLYRNGRSGVLLPQVPVDEHWDRAAFLRYIGIKAGLSQNAWNDPASDLFSFTAVVFDEKHERK